MHRIRFSESLTGKNKATITEPETIHKLSKVLRVKTGEHLVLFDKEGKEFDATVETINAKEVAVAIEAELRRETEPVQQVHLYPSLFKKNRFEWMLEKCTEIGVASIHPVMSEHSIVKTEQTPVRWQKIIEEAARQSGRTTVPAAADPEPLKSALAQTEVGTIIAATEQHGTINISSAIRAASGPIHLFIGPEGGWSPAELLLFKKRDAIFASLGPRILRAETACIVFSAFCIYASEEGKTRHNN